MSTFKLGEICQLSKGKTITRATATEGNIPVIGGGLGPTYYHDKSNIDAPVITISASGANAGFVNYWDIPIWASDCTTIIELPDPPATIGFIYKYLQSRQEFINTELRRGSAQPHVYPSDIADLEIELPPLEKQIQMVEKLDSGFSEIDLLEENLARSSDSIMEIEASLVANLWVKYAKELSKTHLDEVAQYKNGTAHEKIVDKNGKFIIVNSKFISSNGLKFKKSSQQLAPLNIGDVVMVLSDVPNGKALAKCFLVDKDETYTLNQRICKLTSEVLLPEFLALNVNRNPYLLSFNNGENQTNLRLNDVLKTPIYVTDKKTQKIIIDEFDEAKNTIVGYSTLNMRKAESLLMLRQSLLSSVFSELESYAS